MIVILAIAVCTTVLVLMARKLKDHEACQPEYRCAYCGRPLPTEHNLAGQPICAACHEEDERVANLDAFEREC